MKKKKCKVVMLPTKKATDSNWIIFKKINGELSAHKGPYTQDYLNHINVTSQHLYITSDDEIKEGDWVYNENTKKHWQFTYGESKSDVLSRWKSIKKIIATTDKSLFIQEKNQCDGCNANLPLDGFIHKDGPGMGIACSKDKYKTQLPQPSNEFIQEYCEQGGIDEVLVEYTPIVEFTRITGTPYPAGDRLKVSNDNTITISKVKDTWTREEVETLIYSAMKSRNYTSGHDFNEWIK